MSAISTDAAHGAEATGRAPNIRSCVGCRSRRPQRDLIRFYAPRRAPDGGSATGRGSGAGCRVRSDLEMRGCGRGAYVCATRGCLEKAVGRGGFARSFRRKLSLDFDVVVRIACEDVVASIEQLSLKLLRDGRAVRVGCTELTGCNEQRPNKCPEQRPIDAETICLGGVVVSPPNGEVTRRLERLCEWMRQLGCEQQSSSNAVKRGPE